MLLADFRAQSRYRLQTLKPRDQLRTQVFRQAFVVSDDAWADAALKRYKKQLQPSHFEGFAEI